MAEVICSQVIDELTEMMNMNKEQVEKTVHESKCDELSAMFNMMMDNKRKDKGRSSCIHYKSSDAKTTSKVHFEKSSLI